MQLFEFSINETRALALKAARGGGLEWGAAEAAEAVVFLSRRGFDGLAALARRFSPDGGSADAACPILTGISFCDLPLTGPQYLGTVSEPALLLHFIARRAAAGGSDPGLTDAAGNWYRPAQLAACLVADLVLVPDGSPWQMPPVLPGRVATDAVTLAALEALASRTLVPASGISRDNAGAGLLDND